MKEENIPVCDEAACFAYMDCRCVLLTDNNFKGKKCPFFKTIAQVEEENARHKERLEKIENGSEENINA